MLDNEFRPLLFLAATAILQAVELVTKKKSLGMGAMHLKADIAAFKAANPNAKLPDFVRW